MREPIQINSHTVVLIQLFRKATDHYEDMMMDIAYPQSDAGDGSEWPEPENTRLAGSQAIYRTTGRSLDTTVYDGSAEFHKSRVEKT